jgi:hypothetical protein
MAAFVNRKSKTSAPMTEFADHKSNYLRGSRILGQQKSISVRMADFVGSKKKERRE